MQNDINHQADVDKSEVTRLREIWKTACQKYDHRRTEVNRQAMAQAFLEYAEARDVL